LAVSNWQPGGSSWLQSVLEGDSVSGVSFFPVSLDLDLGSWIVNLVSAMFAPACNGRLTYLSPRRTIELLTVNCWVEIRLAVSSTYVFRTVRFLNCSVSDRFAHAVFPNTSNPEVSLSSL